MKNISLPYAVINAVNCLDPVDRGHAFSAVFALVEGKEIAETLSPAAMSVFELAKIILLPLIERRRRDAERRILKKQQSKSEKVSPENDSQKPMSESVVQQVKVQMNKDEPAMVDPEHVRVMKDVVWFACQTSLTDDLARRRILDQLRIRYPGKYSDIKYDRHGNVTLIPALPQVA